MSIKKRANIAREREKRSLIDGLSTNIYGKNGKIILNGRDHADILIRQVNPLERK